MRHTLALGLGGGGRTVSSSDGPNAMGVKYKVRVSEAAPAHAGVSARLVCRMGERAVATASSHDAGGRLTQTGVGEILEESRVAMPTAFQTEIPTTCETEFFYVVSPPLSSGPDRGPSPDPIEVSLGRVCLSGGALVAGQCDDGELGRTPSTAPIEITAVDARIAERPEGGFGLALTAMATAGDQPPPRFTITAKAECESSDGRHDASVPFVFVGRTLRGGESLVYGTQTPKKKALREKPAACDVAFQLRVDEAVTPLSQHCVRGETTTPGACA